ncbi:MAG: hypothetical protein JWN14_1697 [Chthonomonadales bacterium]|nr:hypothetical protein [Chthonomonadales bacterium]
MNASTRAKNTSQNRTEALLAELSDFAYGKSQARKWLRPFFFVGKMYIIGYLLFILLLHFLAPNANLDTTLGHLFSILFYGWIVWTVVGDTRAGKVRVQKLIQELSEDLRAAGPLAQICLSAPFGSMFDIAATPLLKLLPRLKASDARYFSDDQMQALLGLLAPRNPYMISMRSLPELPLAIVKALEQIGDSRAIEPVKRLTTGRGNWRYHKAAQECLRYLIQHGEERNQNRSLLLPSSLETEPETLLRAAKRQAEAQSEQLLRAAIDEERG